MRISVIVLVWNGERFIDACLSALLQQDFNAEIIVVDNHSTDQSIARIQKFLPRVRLIRNDYNWGYAEGNNIGIRSATGDVVILLNQDTMVQPGWLRALTETFVEPMIGIVGCKIFQPDGKTLLHAGAGVRADSAETWHIGQGEIDQGLYDRGSEPDYVTGAAIAIHRRVLEKLGKLDRQFYPAFYEDIDLCYRARRAGFRVVYQPRAIIYHHETTSLTPDSYPHRCAGQRNRIRFVLRHWNIRELEDFATAERQGIGIDPLPDDLRARARAYWDNLLAVPLIVAQRQHDDTLGESLSAGQSRWLIAMLQSLREQARQRLVALVAASEPAALAGGNTESDADRMTRIALDQLQASLNRLETVWRDDFRFKSNVPVLGSLIARAREMFLRYSGVRQYIQIKQDRQVALYAAMKQSLEQSMQAQWRLAKQNAALMQLHELASADDAAILTAWDPLLDRLMDLEMTARKTNSELTGQIDGRPRTND